MMMLAYGIAVLLVVAGLIGYLRFRGSMHAQLKAERERRDQHKP
jgi:hypothetical protein